MKVLVQLASIMVLCLVSEIISTIIPLNVTIIAFLFLLLLLLTGVVRLEWIAAGGDLLLKYMPLFFISAGVKVIEEYDIIRNVVVPFLCIVILSTVLTFAVTALVVSITIKLTTREKEGKSE